MEASLKNHYLLELSCGSGVTGGLGFEPLYSGGFWTKTLLGLQPSPVAVALASCSSLEVLSAGVVAVRCLPCHLPALGLLNVPVCTCVYCLSSLVYFSEPAPYNHLYDYCYMLGVLTRVTRLVFFVSLIFIKKTKAVQVHHTIVRTQLPNK